MEIVANSGPTPIIGILYCGELGSAFRRLLRRGNCASSLPIKDAARPPKNGPILWESKFYRRWRTWSPQAISFSRPFFPQRQLMLHSDTCIALTCTH
jgi:hypothetical protein